MGLNFSSLVRRTEHPERNRLIFPAQLTAAYRSARLDSRTYAPPILADTQPAAATWSGAWYLSRARRYGIPPLPQYMSLTRLHCGPRVVQASRRTAHSSSMALSTCHRGPHVDPGWGSAATPTLVSIRSSANIVPGSRPRSPHMLHPAPAPFRDATTPRHEFVPRC